MPNQDELIVQHMPLVKKIAGHLFSLRSFDGVPFDEYVQFGAEGLIHAVHRYDPALGAKFETYAAHRIKGAIISGLEKSSEVNQQVNTLRRLRQERLNSIAAAAAHLPEAPSSEINGALVRLVDASLGLAVAFMLEDTSLYHDTEMTCWDDGASNMAYKQLSGKLNHALNSLPESERKILEHHYFEHDSFDLIAQYMSISRSRVSQLHRKALERLRAALAVKRLDDLMG